MKIFKIIGTHVKPTFPHTPSESGTFPPCGLDKDATFKCKILQRLYILQFNAISLDNVNNYRRYDIN